MSQFREMLQHCSDLEDLEMSQGVVLLSHPFSLEPPPRDSEPVVLSALRSLTLVDMQDPTEVDFMALIAAPSLEHLALKDVLTARIMTLAWSILSKRFAAYAAQFGHFQSLHELHILNFSSSSSFKTFLPLFTAVRTLRITITPSEDAEMSLTLEPLEGERKDYSMDYTDYLNGITIPPVCPLLKDLHVDGAPLPELLHVMQTRRTAGVALKTISLDKKRIDPNAEISHGDYHQHLMKMLRMKGSEERMEKEPAVEDRRSGPIEEDISHPPSSPSSSAAQDNHVNMPMWTPTGSVPGPARTSSPPPPNDEERGEPSGSGSSPNNSTLAHQSDTKCTRVDDIPKQGKTQDEREWDQLVEESDGQQGVWLSIDSSLLKRLAIVVFIILYFYA